MPKGWLKSIEFGNPAGPSPYPYGWSPTKSSANWGSACGSESPQLSIFPIFGSLVQAEPVSSVPWMNLGDFFPVLHTAWIWLTVAKSWELYVTTAFELFAALLLLDEAPCPGAIWAGFPLDKLLRSLVRRMYSLRQDARPVKRVKRRRSERSSSWISGSDIRRLNGFGASIASWPGK